MVLFYLQSASKVHLFNYKNCSHKTKHIPDLDFLVAIWLEKKATFLFQTCLLCLRNYFYLTNLPNNMDLDLLLMLI